MRVEIICVKNERSRLNFFLFSFQFIFLYSIFRTRVKVTRSHCHTSVISHDMVTVMVISHMTQERT